MSLIDELKSRISGKLNITENTEELGEAKTYSPMLARIEVRPTSKTDPRHLGTIPTFGEKSNLGNDDEYNTALAAAHEAGKKTFGGKYDISHVDHRGQFIRAGSVAKVRRMMKEEVESLNEMQKHIVNVTVSDPNHPAVSKRKEKFIRKATVAAMNKEHAITSAIAFYKRQGYKVHDDQYVGLKEEVESLDEISQEVATRAYGRRANNAYELGDRYTNDAEKADAEKESDKASKAYDRIGRKFGKAGQKKADAQADAVTYGGKAPYKEEVELDESHLKPGTKVVVKDDPKDELEVEKSVGKTKYVVKEDALKEYMKELIKAKLMEGEPAYYKGKNTGPMGKAPAGTIAADRADPVKGKKIRDELKAINSRPKKPVEPFKG